MEAIGSILSASHVFTKIVVKFVVRYVSLTVPEEKERIEGSDTRYSDHFVYVSVFWMKNSTPASFAFCQRSTQTGQLMFPSVQLLKGYTIL